MISPILEVSVILLLIYWANRSWRNFLTVQSNYNHYRLIRGVNMSYAVLLFLALIIMTTTFTGQRFAIPAVCIAAYVHFLLQTTSYQRLLKPKKVRYLLLSIAVTLFAGFAYFFQHIEVYPFLTALLIHTQQHAILERCLTQRNRELAIIYDKYLFMTTEIAQIMQKQPLGASPPLRAKILSWRRAG